MCLNNDGHVTSAVLDTYENTLLVGCLLGERCSAATLHLPRGFSVKLQLRQGSTHRRVRDWPLHVPDMAV